MTTSIDISKVTQEQLDRCHEITHENTGEVFFMVESDGVFDQDNNLLEYKVRFTEQGFTCSCGQGDCGHIVWTAAYMEALFAERREQSQIESYVRQGVPRETATAVVYAQGTIFPESEVAHAQYNNKREPFSILR